MKSLFILHVTLSLLTFTLVVGPAASDPICDQAEIKADGREMPIPFLDDQGCFQLVLERNQDDLHETEEIIEYFDGTRNMGRSETQLGPLKILTFSFYDTNELFTIDPNGNCKVENLNESYLMSPFYVETSDGAPHIKSFVNMVLKNPQNNFVYTGDSNVVRGIPVNQWESCSSADGFTNHIVVSFSDDSKWNPAEMNKNRPIESIPVEIVVTSQKNSDQDQITKSYYTITQFKSFLTLEVDQFFTPSGVYCKPSRQNGRELPKMPESFSYTAQIVDQNIEADPDGIFERKSGYISNVFQEYDMPNQLFHVRYDEDNYITSEIHDFNTGLKYTYSGQTGGCEIEKIESRGEIGSSITWNTDEFNQDGKYVSLRNPAQFFDINSDFQYIGMKRRDGVTTDVWIGPHLTYQDLESYLEWSFLAETWTKNNSKTSLTPIQVNIIAYIPVPNSDKRMKAQKQIHIFNFVEKKDEGNTFDLSHCQSDKLKKRYFRFGIWRDDKIAQAIRENQMSFKKAVFDALKAKARVTALRIANIQIASEKDMVSVLFTLYERAQGYGNVEIPEYDYASDDAIARLKNAFRGGEVKIEFVVKGDSMYTVTANRWSFRETTDYNEGFYQLPNIRAGYSSFFVAVLVILMLVLGAAIGYALTIIEKKYLRVMKFLY